MIGRRARQTVNFSAVPTVDWEITIHISHLETKRFFEEFSACGGMLIA